MSVVGMYGFTGIPYMHNKEDWYDALIEILNDKSVDHNTRSVAMILALWCDQISIGKAESLLLDIGIIENYDNLVMACKTLVDKINRYMEE